MSYSHAFYVDESGRSEPHHNVNHLWISAAVSIAFDKKGDMDNGVKQILTRNFRPYAKELKGSDIGGSLLKGRTASDVAHDVNALLVSTKSRIWVTGTRHGINPLPGKTRPFGIPKDIARQLLLERLSGFLAAGYDFPAKYLLLWDISDQQELEDFSGAVAVFENAYSGHPLNPRLAPAVLGGLSHDWSGLQLADVIANYAMHRVGVDYGLHGANQQKANAFDAYFEPLLQRDQNGAVVGWKIW